MENSLYSQALSEGAIDGNGSLCVSSGSYTARHPKAKHIVTDSDLPIIFNDYHHALDENIFLDYWQQSQAYCHTSGHYQVGNHPKHNIHVNVQTELKWHQLFSQHLFLPPKDTPFSQWTLRACPNMRPSKHPVLVAISFKHRKVLICGTGYAGEIKKSMFTVMNALLPQKNILPMHCSAILSPQGEASLLLGLSGTGKTSLSSADNMTIIGDDEHAWCEDGIYNLEGGSYAKIAHLSREKEPQIFNALHKPAILENVLLNNSQANFKDLSKTENIRAAYPLSHLTSYHSGIAPHPRHIIFLCCDLFGVIPPLSCLTPEQAVSHFLIGYTARVGSTETGKSSGITPVSSPCFGHPFFPLPLRNYTRLFENKILTHSSKIWLVNTGWHNGNVEHTNRIPIATTRHIIQAIINNQVPHFTKPHPYLDLQYIPQIHNQDLSPSQTWIQNPSFRQGCQTLLTLFSNALEKHED